jgi:hypothetical protein
MGGIVRTVIGLALGIALFLGIPVIQSVVRGFGYYDSLSFEQAALGILIVLASIIAIQLTALRTPPPPRPPRD